MIDSRSTTSESRINEYPIIMPSIAIFTNPCLPSIKPLFLNIRIIILFIEFLIIMFLFIKRLI